MQRLQRLDVLAKSISEVEQSSSAGGPGELWAPPEGFTESD